MLSGEKNESKNIMVTYHRLNIVNECTRFFLKNKQTCNCYTDSKKQKLFIHQSETHSLSHLATSQPTMEPIVILKKGYT